MRGRVRAREILDLLRAGAFPEVTNGGDLTSRQRLGMLTDSVQRLEQFNYRSIGLGEVRAAFDAWEGYQQAGGN